MAGLETGRDACETLKLAAKLDVEAMRLLNEHGADPDVATVKQPPRRRPMDEADEEAEPMEIISYQLK